MNTEKLAALLTEGIARFKKQDWAGAERACRGLIELKPDHADGLHLLGLTMHQQGNTTDALSLIKQAVTKDPENSQYHNNLALIYLSLGNLPAAEHAAAKASVLAPLDAEARTTLGLALQHQGRHSEAAASYGKAISLKPDYLQAHVNLGTLNIERQNFVSAESAFRSALQIAPQSTDAAAGLGKSLIILGRPNDAVPLLHNTLSFGGENKMLSLTLAEALLRSNDPVAANTLLEETARLHSSDSMVWNDLGYALRDLDRNEETLKAFERALTIDPDNTNSAINIVLTHLTLGNFEPGCQYYQHRNDQPAIAAKRPVHSIRPWKGEPLNELATVVWKEQGLGDEILQASLVPDLCQLVDAVTLLCSKRLVKLFDHSFGKLQVLAKDDAARAFQIYSDAWPSATKKFLHCS